MMNASDRLRIIIENALKHFQLINHKEWTAKPNADKWSKQEVLGHLIDSCMTNTRRLVVTQYEQNHTILYKQNEWVSCQGYQSANYKELINLWKLLNMQLAKTIDLIPAEKMQFICITNEPHTLEWLIEDYIRHTNHHLQQITGQS
jgi:DinB superfamily